MDGVNGPHRHDLAHSHGRWRRIIHALGAHSHDSVDRVDAALEATAEGVRTLKISLVGLGVTAVLQLLVVTLSGSVALLGDTMHNFADALTSLPLWIAFNIGRRQPTARFTYGFGKAEDLAGLFIVLAIAASAAFAAYEAIRRLVTPDPIDHLPLVIAAGIVGFVGNEAVAVYRIRTGRRIGSAALIADGMHSRTDGLTSLAVVAGAIGVASGFDAADPIAGLLITGALLFVLAGAAREVFGRLMDAVDPVLVQRVRSCVVDTPGVEGVTSVRVRWLGHTLQADVEVAVRAEASVRGGHDIAVDIEHRLLHDIPRLSAALVHINPALGEQDDAHAAIAHHRTEG